MTAPGLFHGFRAIVELTTNDIADEIQGVWGGVGIGD